jgi:hypothetical protein
VRERFLPRAARHSSTHVYAGVACLLSLLSAAAVWYFFSHGWLQWYGDAEAHLNHARRIFDSRHPGYDQIGSPWLPLPHLLILSFVQIDGWWRSGIAGAVPSAAFFVLGGTFLFASVWRIFNSAAAAVAATSIAALNPNLLYLQSTSMNEAIFFGTFMAVLYFTLRGSAAGAGIAACAGTLTRYEGWFVLPFLSLYFLRRGLRPAIVFSLLAGMGPIYWLFHNWYLSGDPLDFYRGPSSAMAIQGAAVYAGQHNWRLAFYYYRHAVQLCAGLPLVILALAGSVAALRKGAPWALLLLALPPAFFVWSVHSAGLPIHMPHLWPHSYYNTRYALAALPLLALAAASLVAAAPERRRAAVASLVILAATLPWLRQPNPESWITWMESRENSDGRRAWTNEAADFLAKRYVRGSGIITSFGDLTGIYRKMGLPLKETFTECDGLAWEATIRRPDLFLWQEWAVAMQNDQVDRAVHLAIQYGIRYELEKTIVKKNEKIIRIYHRAGGMRGVPVQL